MVQKWATARAVLLSTMLTIGNGQWFDAIDDYGQIIHERPSQHVAWQGPPARLESQKGLLYEGRNPHDHSTEDPDRFDDEGHYEHEQNTIGYSQEAADYVAKCPMNWTAYQRLDVIYDWMFDMAEKYPAWVKVVHLGTSFQRRPIKALKLNRSRTSRTIIIDAGIHGREWIAPATGTFLAKTLIEEHSRHRHLLESFVWYFIPVFNPDGYEYTHTHDRMWRKTRSNHRSDSQAGECIGVDANRNFDIEWKTGKEATATPCDNVFPGFEPESENCVQAFRDFVLDEKKRSRIVAYFTLHSFGQKWLHPYGYKADEPPNIEDLTDVAEMGLQATQAFKGARYTYGSSLAASYHVSGTSRDWMYKAANVPFSYTIELPPGKSNSDNGFILPAQEIIPVGRETFQGIRAAVFKISELLRAQYE